MGIDLGTTNSLVAVAEGSTLRTLPIDGQALLPSVVGLDEQGRRIVGQAARNQYVVAPERTVRSIKRQMGRADHVVRLGGSTHTPEEISAFILGRLAEEASAQLGQTVRRAVVTVPAYFTDRQRQATVRAGELAGLEVVRLLHEPTAAALAYGRRGGGETTALVYDLGGGTFDVSVVEMGEGITEVRASHGNRELGGDDFDERIVDWLVREFEGRHGYDLRPDLVAMARVRRAAEDAKIHLSDHAYAEIREEFLVSREGRALHLEAELTRSQFEEMIRPLLLGTLDSVRRALRESGVDARALDDVLLVGGSTRIPAVWELVAEELGRAPRQDLNPEEVVALGAAVQAAVVEGRDVDAILVDVCPHSMGVRVLHLEDGQADDDVFAPLIRRNTAIPVSHSQFFYTTHPEQDTVDIEVYQGEEPAASRNTHLGRIRFEGLSPSPDGGPREVLVAFDYDVSGMLHVSAVDRRTGRREEARLDTVALTRSPAGDSLPSDMRALLQRLRGLQAPEEETGVQGGLAALLSEAEALAAHPDPESMARWKEAASAFLFEHSAEY